VAYNKNTKSPAKNSDVPVFTEISGLGQLKAGSYVGKVASIYRGEIQFDVLPIGFHCERLSIPELEVGDEVGFVIGVDKRGLAVRKNRKGEYALVHPHERDTPVTGWLPSITQLVASIPESAALTSPIIASVTKDGAVLYTNENAYVGA